ncbi:MAG TPA: hypothetical protein VGS28_04350 [Candidatus Saccharimonadales bacterium]|nr:hypothetical protein [Candidatus Saccharimonadales bacterium]
MKLHEQIAQKIISWFTLSNILPLGVVLIAFWWAWSTVDVIQRNFTYQQQVNQLQQQVAVLSLENKSEQYMIDYYKTNEYDQLQARTYLNLAAPGEKELILSSAPSGSQYAPFVATVQPTSGSTTTQAKSNFQQWVYFLFSKHGA